MPIGGAGGADDTAGADDAAYRHFEALRWPDGPGDCPHCGRSGRCRFVPTADGSARATRTGAATSRRVWRCGHCGRQFSVLTGTVFEGTRVPLRAWLAALELLSSRPSGTWTASAGELSRTCGVGRETARAMTALVAHGAAAAQLQG